MNQIPEIKRNGFFAALRMTKKPPVWVAFVRISMVRIPPSPPLKKALLSTKGKGACKHPEHGDGYTK